MKEGTNMQNKKQDTCYVSETITIIRPQLKNKIFNEDLYKIIQTYDENGDKVIWLREKIKQEKKLSGTEINAGKEIDVVAPKVKINLKEKNDK